MKILYVGKHNSGGNDDEGAVAFALESLGHTVIRIPENQGHTTHQYSGDLLLFHKWYDTTELKKLKIPKVFWYFDLVDFPDPSLNSRNCGRVAWMTVMMPYVNLGFCTDGDWAVKYPKKLVTLRQGADSRFMGRGIGDRWSPAPILFPGIKNGGIARSGHVHHLSEKFGDRFQRVEGVHGRDLANLIASSSIVVAPDGPITDRYWSNRVYLTLGFGAFLLHPYCLELAKEYEDGTDLVFYRSREDLDEKIEHYLNPDQAEERDRISSNGMKKTLEKYTYIKRCEQLMKVVQERLDL